MPGNWGYLKHDIFSYLTENYGKDCTVLDVGAGGGFYWELLHEHFNKMDAVEIWEPYIEWCDLRSKYDNVFNIDILNFDFDYYDIIIMGDVLEHISRKEAQPLMHKLKDKCKELLVIIPYELPQEEAAHDNPYEIHLQPDINDEIVAKYYPMLKLLRKIPVDEKGVIKDYCAFIKKTGTTDE